MGRRKGHMSFRDAMELVDDDLPDGAFFAIAHEIAGLDYGDGFDELAEEELGEALPGDVARVVVPRQMRPPGPMPRRVCCIVCRKKFPGSGSLDQHYSAKPRSHRRRA